MKKMPIAFPTPALLSLPVDKDAGILISYNPKKDNAKKMNVTKKKIFRYTLVEILFNISGFIESRK